MQDKPRKRCIETCGVHQIFCCGSKVEITKNGVAVSTEPVVEHCPLHETLYGVKKIDRETVQNSVERKMADFGFCCRDRRFKADPIVAYGASEMMSVWLRKGLIDCAIVVCDGAGTVTTDNAELVQGIGARLTGIAKTSPIPDTIKHIEKSGGRVLDKATARIDQVLGTKQAFSAGSQRIAVTVASFQAEAISQIRHIESAENKHVVIFSVCNTLATKADVKHIERADIACASASMTLRNEVGKKALLQVGTTIPVYALTQRGKELVLSYLAAFEDKLVIFRTDELPYKVKGRGPTTRART